MQELRRRIAYLYAYEYGRRTRSCGFIKAETHGNICRLDICLKSFGRPQEDAGTAYLYMYRRNRIIALPLGSLSGGFGGSLSWHGLLDPGNVLGKKIRIADTGGVWLKRPDGRDYIAEWNDRPVDVGRFLPYPDGGERCIRCPRFGYCERSSPHAVDRR